MRIISQDRKQSVDFKRAYLWMQYNTIYVNYGNERKVFGTYETDERASEVFMDIHEAYEKNICRNNVYLMPDR